MAERLKFFDGNTYFISQSFVVLTLKKTQIRQKNLSKKSIKSVSSRKEKARKMGASSAKIKRMITKTQQ